MFNKKPQRGSFLNCFIVVPLLCALSLNICARLDTTLVEMPVQSQQAIHVLFSSLDAGETVTEGFRLTAAGQLSHASWNDENKLLGLSAVGKINEEGYRKALTVLTALPLKPGEQTEDSELSSPPVLTLELSLPQANDNKRYAVFLDDIPASVPALLAQWRTHAPLKPVQPGNYLWLIPAAPNQTKEDIKVPLTNPADSLEANILRGLSGHSLVIPVNGNLDDFQTGERKYRSRFIARLRNSFAYFGVLNAP